MATLEISTDNRTILFLASSVPYIEFGKLVLKGKSLHLEVNGCDRCPGLLWKFPIDICGKQSGFADTAIAYKDDFIFVLILIIKNWLLHP